MVTTLQSTLHWLLDAGVDGFNLHDTAHLAFTADGKPDVSFVLLALGRVAN